MTTFKVPSLWAVHTHLISDTWESDVNPEFLAHASAEFVVGLTLAVATPEILPIVANHIIITASNFVFMLF